jgi:hypothetical protein
MGSLFVTVLFTHPPLRRIESQERSSQIGLDLGTRALETWRQAGPGFGTAMPVTSAILPCVALRIYLGLLQRCIFSLLD